MNETGRLQGRAPVRLSAHAVAGLSLCLLAATVAAMAMPFGRFPHQDLLFADLYLASKVAFAADAWRGHLFATMDFTQGFGESIYAEPKMVPHLFDPAALLALALPLPGALIARTALLALLGALGLAQIVTAGAISRLSLSDFALVAAYFAVPQFFFETSLLFYGLFLCLPMLYWRLRCIATAPSVRSWLALCAVGAVAIGVSDIHMVGFVPLVVAFALLMGEPVERRATVVAGSMLMLLTVVEYWPMLGDVLYAGEAVRARGAAAHTFTSYSLGFVAIAAVTAVAPIFAGPVSLYLNPVLLAEFGGLACVRGRWAEAPPLVRRARGVAMASGLLLFGGAAVYVVPSIAARLPSLLRYHVAFIPFMITVLVATARAQATGRDPTRVSAERPSANGWPLAILVLSGSTVSALAKLALDVSRPYVAQMETATPGMSQWTKLIARLLTPLAHPEVLWPVLLAAFGVIAFAMCSWMLMRTGRDQRAGTSGRPGHRFVMPVVCLAVLFGGMYAQSWTGASLWRWQYDQALRGSLLGDLPGCIDSLTRKTGATGARSLLPVAVSIDGMAEGRNDILLSAIELPDGFGARSAFQWRYGYTKANRLAYGRLTGDTLRSQNFWPPGAARMRTPATSAGLLGANVVLAADTVLLDPSLEALGSCRVPGQVPENPSLVGYVSVYGVRPVEGDALFSGATLEEVHRTFARVRVEAPAVLPVAYSTSLRAREQDGTPVLLSEDSSGLARVEGLSAGSQRSQSLMIDSRDGRRGYSLFALILCAFVGSVVLGAKARAKRPAR